MNYPFPRILVCYCIIFLFTSCKSTYPRDQVEDSIRRICAEEFKINVIPRIEGNTVFAYIKVNDLLPNLAAADEELIAGLSNVMHSLSRVVLSSDYPFQFIVLHALDARRTGIYVTITRYVDDIRRLLTGDISHDEYGRRMVHSKGIDRHQIPAYFVLSLFDLFGDLTAPADPKSSDPVLFFLSRKNRQYTVRDLRSIKTGTDTYAVYCMTEEIMEHRIYAGNDNIRETTEIPEPLYGVGFGAYIIFVDIEATATVTKVVPLSYINDNGSMISNEAAKLKMQYGDPSAWEQHFPVDVIRLSDFLAEQISQRIKYTIATDPQWSKKYLSHNVTGTFIEIDSQENSDTVPVSRPAHAPEWLLQNSLYRYTQDLFGAILSIARRFIPSPSHIRPPDPYGIFRFTLDTQDRILFMIQRQLGPAFGSKERDLFDEIDEKIIHRTLDRYGFFNYKEIELINPNTGLTRTIPR